MKLWATRTLNLALAAALLVLAPGAWTRTAAAEGTMTPAQQKRMLRVMSGVPKDVLGRMAGMTPEAAEKIAAWRVKNYEFTSVEQIKQVSGLPDSNFEELRGAFMKKIPDEEANTSLAGAGKPAASPPDKAGAGKKAGLGRSNDKAGIANKETPFELNLSVRPHYYSELPGYDLGGLTEAQKTAFLDVVNRELCSCGCQDETLGFCLVNDPGCPIVKARIRKIYKDMIGSDPVPPKETKNP